MAMIDWTKHGAAFIQDGSLRDIYVHDSTVRDWEALLSIFQSPDFSVKYERDGDETPMPASAASVFADQAASHNLTATINGIDIACHFFSTDEIELDVDPRQVTGQASLETILAFMNRLGSRLSKDVILTEENSPEHIWFRYSHAHGPTRYVWTG